MAFGALGQLRDGLDLVGRQAGRHAAIELDVAHALRLELDVLVRELGLDDVEHHLVDEEAIGRDGAADDGLAEPERGLDRDHAAVAVGGVERHRDAGRVGVDHPLHDDGHLRLGDAALLAVGDRALGVQARPALAATASITASSPTTHR